MTNLASRLPSRRLQYRRGCSSSPCQDQEDIGGKLCSPLGHTFWSRLVVLFLACSPFLWVSMFKPSRDTSHKPTPSSSVTATNNINLIMSHTPLLSDCGSTGSTLGLTLDGVSTHDGVITLEEDEANVRSKAETSSVVCSSPILIRPFSSFYGTWLCWAVWSQLLWRFWWLSIGANILHKLFSHQLLFITHSKLDPFLYWQYHPTYEQNTEQRPLSANTILLSFTLPWQILSLNSLIDVSGKFSFSYIPTFRWSLHLWLGHLPKGKGSIRHCLDGACQRSSSGIGRTVRWIIPLLDIADFNNQQVCPSYLINVYSTLTKQKLNAPCQAQSNEVGEAWSC